MIMQFGKQTRTSCLVINVKHCHVTIHGLFHHPYPILIPSLSIIDRIHRINDDHHSSSLYVVERWHPIPITNHPIPITNHPIPIDEPIITTNILKSSFLFNTL